MARLDTEKLKSRRVERDLTQKDLAEKSGVNLNTIKQIETDRSMTSAENIAAIAGVLGLKLEDVYFPDFRNTVVISIINNKGGCGKTSVTGGLGTGMAEAGKKVLLIDGDAQRNLSSSFDMPKSALHFGDAVLKEQDIQPYIQPTQWEGIDMVVGDVSMSTLDMSLFTKIQRENIVRNILRPVVEKGIYDYILIDTNPTLSMLNFNIVNASDYAIIPVQPAGFDVDGLGTVMDFIQGIRRYNDTVKIAGIAINRYDARNKLISEASIAQLRESYSDLLFDTVIHSDAKLQNAQWENRPVADYSPSSRIAREYRSLTEEVMKRCR